MRRLVHDEILQILPELAVILAADQAHARKFHAAEGQRRFHDRHLAIGIAAELVAVDLQRSDAVVQRHAPGLHVIRQV